MIGPLTIPRTCGLTCGSSQSVPGPIAPATGVRPVPESRIPDCFLRASTRVRGKCPLHRKFLLARLRHHRGWTVQQNVALPSRIAAAPNSRQIIALEQLLKDLPVQPRLNGQPHPLINLFDVPTSDGHSQVRYPGMGTRPFPIKDLAGDTVDRGARPGSAGTAAPAGTAPRSASSPSTGASFS